MYGDATVIRRRAGELKEQAVDIRALADRVAAGADSIEWSGRAADDLRARMRVRATQLRESATLHENASETLTKHAVSIGDLAESIARIEKRAESLIADARSRQAEVDSYADAEEVTRTVSAEDRMLLDFVPPPRRHKDWLSVSLPGL